MTVRLLAFAAAVALLSGSLTAQEKKAGGAPDQKMQEMMQKMAAHGTPGPAHEALKQLVGKWTYKGKMWMDPAAPPMEMTGTSERKLIMEGRFLTDHIKGDPPMPFEGMGWSGYDNHSKKYWYTWIDSMTTSVMTAEGTYDAKTKTLTFNSECYDPGEGKVCKGKDVTVFKGNNEIVQTFYKLEGGKEVKMMEITSTRAK